MGTKISRSMEFFVLRRLKKTKLTTDENRFER